jgi:uncharacterized membrane protein
MHTLSTHFQHIYFLFFSKHVYYIFGNVECCLIRTEIILELGEEEVQEYASFVAGHGQEIQNYALS